MSKALLDILVRRIRSQGPITVADYMSEALSHPEHGYYQKQDPFGCAGDFITSPEISQMFGELIGLWCADTWQGQGSSRSCALVEMGPGRGTLMADVLRAANTLPAFRRALEVHLVETSPVLRRTQQENLAARAEVTWHKNLENLPQCPTYFLANEFFDALPVHQYQRSETGWHERLVGLTDDGKDLAFGLSGPLPSSLCHDLPECRPGDVIEVCPAALSYADIMARHVCRYRGAALWIDYGYDHTSVGDTLQAVKQHSYHCALQDPGEADLTAHVDFGALGKAAESVGARIHGPVGQGTFLKALGIETRAALLAETATPNQRAVIAAALQRLTDTEQMGTLFRVMAITPSQAPTPAGFPVSESLCTEGRVSG